MRASARYNMADDTGSEDIGHAGVVAGAVAPGSLCQLRPPCRARVLARTPRAGHAPLGAVRRPMVRETAGQPCLRTIGPALGNGAQDRPPAARRQTSRIAGGQPRRLAMDEFALFKGHRYATVVLDADTRQVLWVGEGRSRDAIRPFFEWLGADRCRHIEAVAMDMNTAFDLEVRQHCPNARVVYDLFHVIAKYGREVIDRVRVDEANRLKDDRPRRQIIKRARWLLLRNKENVPADQQPKLDELLAANQALMTTYVMKASLKELWQASTAAQWRRAWKDWLRMANESEIEPLRRFARRLKSYWRGIIARVRWPMHTGQLEGINNRIKVMKRMAYGYRDSNFFFLKIKAAFPGNP